MIRLDIEKVENKEKIIILYEDFFKRENQQFKRKRIFVFEYEIKNNKVIPLSDERNRATAD